MQHRGLPFVTYGILLLACGLICRGESEASTQENEGKIFTINDLLEEKQLDIMEWEDGPGFIDKLLEKRVPVLLKNSPASQWAAVKTWNPKHMAEKASKATGVKIYNKRKFPVGCCELNPMSQKDFWERVEKSQESGEYMYFNGQAHILGHALEKEIGPKFFMEREGRMTNVWMGNKGATAPLHHDPFENFFVQVYGTKKFYLFPPSEHRNLYVHPKTHAMHRHAQVDIDTPDLEKYPELAHARGFTLLVEPGTVFYLPPFWFHQVESLTDTISINTWYPSTVVEQMGEAWDENMPFDPEWSDVKFVTAVKYVISKMISTVYPGEDSVKQFISELVRTRFVPLYKNSSAVDLLTGCLMTRVTSTILSPEAKFDDTCHMKLHQYLGANMIVIGVNTVKDPHLQVHLREQQELDATIFAPSLTDQEFCGGPPDFIEGEKSVLKEFKGAIKRLSSKFSNAPKDLRDVQMEDYIEDMIGQTVGDKKVFKFLQECF